MPRAKRKSRYEGIDKNKYPVNLPLVARVMLKGYRWWLTTVDYILHVDSINDVIAAAMALTGMEFHIVSDHQDFREAVGYIYNRKALEWRLWTGAEDPFGNPLVKTIPYEFYENYRIAVNSVGIEYLESERRFTVASAKKKAVAKGTKSKGTAAVPEKKKRRTIMNFVKEVFETDPEITTTDLIKLVVKNFPESKFSKSHVSWYRNHFRKQGMDIPKLHREKKAVKKTVKKKVAKKKVVKKK